MLYMTVDVGAERFFLPPARRQRPAAFQVNWPWGGNNPRFPRCLENTAGFLGCEGFLFFYCPYISNAWRLCLGGFRMYGYLWGGWPSTRRGGGFWVGCGKGWETIRRGKPFVFARVAVPGCLAVSWLVREKWAEYHQMEKYINRSQYFPAKQFMAGNKTGTRNGTTQHFWACQNRSKYAFISDIG